LGFYNPRTDPSTVQIKEDRLFDWMSKGAQPSESVTKSSTAWARWNALSASRLVSDRDPAGRSR
jgi:small subunit ribosomal protein S16